jgi:S-(hydroxymethyl)glutathione dehydrogenase/alcohol dehydrogenase
MKTRGAVLRSAPGKFEVVELELDEPRQNEIRVKLAAAGLCHSDDHAQTGDMPLDHLPMVCGHEGAGVIEAVGPNTPGFEVGDHVIFSFIPVCGKCRWCNEGLTNLCDLGKDLLLGSRPEDPTSFRVTLDGQPAGQMSGLGAFAERTVVNTASAVKIDKHLPLDVMSLLGCGVGTGWGSAVYAGDVKPGDVVLVMGIGGIGANAVQGAAHAGANTVIAVDPVQFKRDTALQLGATHTFAGIDEATDFARSVTNGQGADVAVVTVGVTNGDHIAQAFTAIRKAGTVVVTGIGDSFATGIPINTRELVLMQKRIQGVLFGACNPLSDIPRQIRMYEAGHLKLDELITRRYRLDEIGQGYEDMHAGTNIRGIIVFD